MKKTITLLLSLSVFLLLCGFSMQYGQKYEAISTDFKIKLMDKNIEFNEPILAVNDKAYLPVRAFSKTLGFDVKWIDGDRTIELSDAKAEVEDGNGVYTTAVVTKKETAIAIAEAFLREHIPYAFDSDSEHFFKIFDETEDTWVVLGIAGLGDFYNEENYDTTFGQGAFVTISKNSGRIVLLESDYLPDIGRGF